MKTEEGTSYSDSVLNLFRCLWLSGTLTLKFRHNCYSLLLA